MESLLHNSLEKQSGKDGVTKTGSGIKNRGGNALPAYLPLPIFFLLLYWKWWSRWWWLKIRNGVSTAKLNA